MSIQSIDLKFASANSVPVERAVVTREEWAAVLADIAKDEEALSRTIDARDYWEGLATRLAESVGEHFNMDVGEHSSANCPVLRAIEILEGYRCAHEVENEALRAERDEARAHLDAMFAKIEEIGKAAQYHPVDEPIFQIAKSAVLEIPQRSLRNIRAAGAREALERAMQEAGFSGTVVRVDLMREIIEKMEKV